MTKKVLLIEDEPHIVKALAFLLKRESWQVEIHNDGIGAANRVSELTPDLVILDVMLPNIGGMEILHDIRHNQQTAKTPVLMLTAKGQQKDRKAAEDAGASLFMTKPFSNQEIVASIRELVN